MSSAQFRSARQAAAATGIPHKIVLMTVSTITGQFVTPLATRKIAAQIKSKPPTIVVSGTAGAWLACTTESVGSPAGDFTCVRKPVDFTASITAAASVSAASY